MQVLYQQILRNINQIHRNFKDWHLPFRYSRNVVAILHVYVNIYVIYRKEKQKVK